MKLQSQKVVLEYTKQKKQNSYSDLEELAYLIERAMENDCKDLLSTLGIVAHIKSTPNNIHYKTIIITKQQYRYSWLEAGIIGFTCVFNKTIKDLLNNNLNRLRFNISLKITKAQDEKLIRDYYDFEFQFKYFGNYIQNDIVNM